MTNDVNYLVQSSSQPAKASVVAHGIPSECMCLVRKNLLDGGRQKSGVSSGPRAETQKFVCHLSIVVWFLTEKTVK